MTLKADDYEKLYRIFGQEAADEAFDRYMRREYIKLGLVIALLLAVAVFAFFTL